MPPVQKAFHIFSTGGFNSPGIICSYCQQSVQNLNYPIEAQKIFFVSKLKLFLLISKKEFGQKEGHGLLCRLKHPFHANYERVIS